MPTTAPFFSLLLLSGGVGARARHHEPKQFYELAGHPMIAHSIIPAAHSKRIGEIVVNAPISFEERTREIMEAYCGGKPYKIVRGGATRQESSYILAQSAKYDDVLLHEAARPFVDIAMYDQLIDCPTSNAGFCHPISFSMCRINSKTGQILKGVSREKVFNIQLPQKFDCATLLRAHEVAIEKKKSFDEDSVMVVEMAKAPVLSLTGSSKNLKITTQEDFVIAKQIFRRDR